LMSDIALIDPMTLVGKEILAEFSRRKLDPDMLSLLHSMDVEEHQVTAAAGQAMMVMRLESVEDLAGCRMVVLCSDTESDRLEALDQIDKYLADPVLLPLLKGAT